MSKITSITFRLQDLNDDDFFKNLKPEEDEEVGVFERIDDPLDRCADVGDGSRKRLNGNSTASRGLEYNLGGSGGLLVVHDA
jgi:hypothetical protein